MSTSRPVCDDDDHAKRSCREHQNFGKLVGSQNANDHGDPHSPPKPAILSASNGGKTKDISRPLVVCGLNQWIRDFSPTEPRRRTVRATAVRDSAFLALPLCLHVGKDEAEILKQKGIAARAAAQKG